MTGFENFIMNFRSENNPADFVKKYYCRLTQGNKNSIYIKSRQFMDNYGDVIAAMSEELFSRAPMPDQAVVYNAYELIKSNIVLKGNVNTFLSGIPRFKFDQIVAAQIHSPVYQTALRLNREKYIEQLENAITLSGRQRLESLIEARKELNKIRETFYYQTGKIDTASSVGKYINKNLDALSAAILHEAGIRHLARATIYDTPEGKRLKFRGEIHNDGFMELKGGFLEFMPYWTDSQVTLDSHWVQINPNNSLIREYTINIDPARLESATGTAFRFIGKIQFAEEIIDFAFRAAAYEKGNLAIEFMPDFLIIEPFEKLRVDRLVEQTSLRAILSKPPEYSGTVKIAVTASQNILPGAYPETLELRAGERAIDLKIPLVITKSIGDQKQEVTISVAAGNISLASDMAAIRQAELKIPADRYMALMPDKSGLIEDILVMAGANYKVISDRFLKSGDFGVYDMIILGSGCFEIYESLDLIRDKFKKYLERGGRIIVFGQPEEWRDDLLPVSLISTAQAVSVSDIDVNDTNHPLFLSNYPINIPRLLESLSGNYTVYPAIIFPGERIISTEGNTAILTVTTIGKGQLLYCGLPLAEMIRELDLDAIEFFSNIIKFASQ